LKLLLAPLVFKFALLDAIENGHVDIVRLLLSLNSDENIVETLMVQNRANARFLIEMR